MLRRESERYSWLSNDSNEYHGNIVMKGGTSLSIIYVLEQLQTQDLIP